MELDVSKQRVSEDRAYKICWPSRWEPGGRPRMIPPASSSRTLADRALGRGRELCCRRFARVHAELLQPPDARARRSAPTTTPPLCGVTADPPAAPSGGAPGRDGVGRGVWWAARACRRRATAGQEMAGCSRTQHVSHATRGGHGRGRLDPSPGCNSGSRADGSESGALEPGIRVLRLSKREGSNERYTSSACD